MDVSILAGLRATYERTLDDALDHAPDGASDHTLDTLLDYPLGGAPDHAPDNLPDNLPDGAPEGSAEASAPPAPSAPPVPPPDPGAVAPLAVDMTRPLIYLTLVSKQEWITGRAVLDALDAEGFRPGLMQLYYWRRDAEPSVVFGVANMVEPGVLDPDALPEAETPGLVPFMSIPEDAGSAFRTLDTMIATCRRLAPRLDATLCDETRSTLTAQAENHLREKVADILRRDRI